MWLFYSIISFIYMVMTEEEKIKRQKEINKRWYEKNKEKIAEKNKQLYVEKKDKILQRVKTYYKKNKKTQKKAMAEYRNMNAETITQKRQKRREVDKQVTRCIYFDNYQCDLTWEEAVKFDKLFKQYNEKLETSFITTGNIDNDGYVNDLFDYRINIDALIADINTLAASDDEEDKTICQTQEWIEFECLVHKLYAFSEEYKIAFILLPRNDWCNSNVLLGLKKLVFLY